MLMVNVNKTLSLLAELWADQNNVKIEKLEIRGKNEKSNITDNDTLPNAM